MRQFIEDALDQTRQLVSQGEPVEKDALARLDETLEAIQSQYLEIIRQALSLLVTDKEEECHELLSRQREELDPLRNRIGGFVIDEQYGRHAYFKLVIEYLFTRVRLVEELKMFPAFGMQLLDRLTLDQSLEETINYLESAMTGKQNLFENLHAAYEVLITGR